MCYIIKQIINQGPGVLVPQIFMSLHDEGRGTGGRGRHRGGGRDRNEGEGAGTGGKGQAQGRGGEESNLVTYK